MSNSNNNKTIVKFHIGRGGRFNNEGFRRYKGAERIDQGYEFDSLFLNEDETEYLNESGNSVELTVEEAESGIGTINQDNGYNTTYSLNITDCGDEELNAIVDADPWNRDQLLSEATGESVETIQEFAMHGLLKKAIENELWEIECYDIDEEE
jgi:hypothetical protein